MALAMAWPKTAAWLTSSWKSSSVSRKAVSTRMAGMAVRRSTVKSGAVLTPRFGKLLSMRLTARQSVCCTVVASAWPHECVLNAYVSQPRPPPALAWIETKTSAGQLLARPVTFG